MIAIKSIWHITDALLVCKRVSKKDYCICDSVHSSVSKFGGSLKFGRWRIRRIFKNLVQTGKFGGNEVEP
jgi:hypothetical protein